MNLLTADELAAELKMNSQVIRKWTRNGIIKPEIKIGAKPRFYLTDVIEQIKAHNAKQDAAKFNGMVPTL